MGQSGRFLSLVLTMRVRLVLGMGIPSRPATQFTLRWQHSIEKIAW